jgi:SAM-dependent methyltransferase
MLGALRALLDRAGKATSIPFRVRFAAGGEYCNSEQPPAFTLIFNTARAERRAALFGHFGILEAYFDGEADIEGSLAKALAAGMEGGADQPTVPVKLLNRWHELLHRNASRTQAQKNAEFHYALGPEFYKLWLDDPYMFYTCAYWKDGTRTLEEAQHNKAEHVARKICLKPGEEVVDVGSGFGGFLLYADERHGAKVTAINTTGSQAGHARKHVESRRLGAAVQMHGDFRDAVVTGAASLPGPAGWLAGAHKVDRGLDAVGEVSRVVDDTPRARAVAALNSLTVQGRGYLVRVLPDDAAIRRFYVDVLQPLGMSRLKHADDGSPLSVTELPGGGRVVFRGASRSGGAAIDVIVDEVPYKRIHRAE